MKNPFHQYNFHSHPRSTLTVRTPDRLTSNMVVLWWVYVDGCLVKIKVGVLWFCDVPVTYAKTVGDGYSSICTCTQVGCAGFFVFVFSTRGIFSWNVVSGDRFCIWVPPNYSFDV